MPQSHGSSRAFDLDPRAVYTVTAGAALVELFDTNKVRVRADAAAGASGSATISVGLPVYAADVTPATVTVHVDAFNTLSLTAAAFPACSSGGCASKTTLRRVQTTNGEYQRVDLTLRTTSVHGGSYGVALTSAVSLTLSDLGILAVATGSTCFPDTGRAPSPLTLLNGASFLGGDLGGRICSHTAIGHEGIHLWLTTVVHDEVMACRTHVGCHG